MFHTEETLIHEEELHGCKVVTVEVRSEQEAKRLGKAVGSFITIHLDTPFEDLPDVFPAGECLAAILHRVLHPFYRGRLCICGLDGKVLLPTSLASEVIRNLPLGPIQEMKKEGNFCKVCSFVPNLETLSNIDIPSAVGAIVKAVGADCVLLISTCTTKSLSRLSQTIQLSTAGGITPYCVDHSVDWSSLGVPVISLGIPVFIPLSLFAPNLSLEQELFVPTINPKHAISAAGTVIAYAILQTCWPTLSKAECFFFSKMTRDPIPYSCVLTEEFE